jgi:hypothetical protein
MSALPSKLLFASLISSATLFSTFAIGSVAQAKPNLNCTVPNNVVCKISSNKGIRSVKVQANTPLGTVDLVNKSYVSCPALVEVSWDSAYNASEPQIAECSGVSGGGGSGSGVGNHGKLKG